MSGQTAVIMIAASVAFGIQKRVPTSLKIETRTTAVVINPERGDLTLHEELTDVRDMAPPTPMAWKKLLKKFATPK